MKPFLKEQYFIHFLSLHCAIRIFICDELIEKYIDYAHELLMYFVSEFGNLYGYKYINHNIHNLIHLTSDVRKFDSLDKFSCFPFENYMHKIKMMLKTSNKPLSQFIKRVNEFDTYASNKIEQKFYLKENGLKCNIISKQVTYELALKAEKDAVATSESENDRKLGKRKVKSKKCNNYVDYVGPPKLISYKKSNNTAEAFKTAFPRITEKDFEYLIMEWFRFANVRKRRKQT
ncbi:hypothetical protein ALC62_00766 [Cyphomyrmex costatus]|uniref:DUF4218 domain-containing protein n=1 Tax=Cyphomyrmex costatus TaxID=456900 RepID=A0A151IQ31_9HYME|nr:hypothetical protein ALC62_00766 [Cyphomyrmex costatus]